MQNTNLPNIITGFRISLVPIFVICFYFNSSTNYPIAFVVFAISMITDWLDGYLARRLQQASNFGAFLDPLADKFIVVVALILLVEEHGNMLFTIPTLVIVLREIMVSGLREWMAELNLRASVEVSFLGKVKTSMQMFAILFFLFKIDYQQELILEIGYACLYLSAIVSVWSMINYLRAAHDARSKNINP